MNWRNQLGICVTLSYMNNPVGFLAEIVVHHFGKIFYQKAKVLNGSLRL